MKLASVNRLHFLGWRGHLPCYWVSVRVIPDNCFINSHDVFVAGGAAMRPAVCCPCPPAPIPRTWKRLSYIIYRSYV